MPALKPQETRNRAVEMYLTGATVRKICSELSITQPVIFRELSKRNTPLKGRATVEHPWLEQALSLRQEGKSYPEIGRILGVNSFVVRSYLYKKVPGLEKRLVHAVFTAKERQTIAGRYVAGEQVRALATDYECSRSVILNILRETGTPQRAVAEIRRPYSLDITTFAQIDSEAKAWSLGLITADGCVSGTRFKISLKNNDQDAVEKIRATIGSDSPIRFARNDQALLVVRSAVLVADLAKLGVVPRKTWCAVPWNGPDSLLPHYYRGLIDGDGWWSKRKGRNCSWTMGLAGTKAICEGFRLFAARFADASLVLREASGCWVASISNTVAIRRLATILYQSATVFMDRKKRLVDQLLGA